MKKIYFIALFALMCNLAMAQIEQTAYRGAFAPAPVAMWTDSWTSWDPQNEPYTNSATVVNVTTDITTNTTWKASQTIRLSGLIYVRNNVTLTIEAGTVIKGVSTSAGTALIITKGSKISAIGTALKPIVFTSDKTSSNRQPGDWGGLVLLGKAGFNLNGGVNNIEGITASVNTEYGGGTSPSNNDNSGTLKYVRIEYAGFVFSPNNELNGLTFGAVGNGTTIDYVQVSSAYDDSFEWFGGSVNCKHLVAFKGLDDDFDTDNGYKGAVQFALAIKDPSFADNPAVSTSEGFESDNNPTGVSSLEGYDTTSAIFSNCTLIGPAKRASLFGVSVASGHAKPLRLRRVTQLKIYNSIFMDFKNNYLFVDGSATVANVTNGTLKFKNNIIAGISSADLLLFPNGVSSAGASVAATNTWMTNSGNTVESSTGLLTKAYGATNAAWAAGNFDLNALNLDYRPGSIASSGASFTDASIAALLTTPVIVDGSTPSVPNFGVVNYCKGALASALTANLSTTGIALKWYKATTASGTQTALTAAPIPTTTTVGIQYYWVSQTTAGAESAKVAITVNIIPLPIEVISVITGQGPVTSASGVIPAVYASGVAVGPYIGTTSNFTYSVTAFTDTTLSYLWTVPNGVNIVSGQGTNTLTVNYANVAPGAATAVGSINLQAVSTAGCMTLAKTLAITKALPAAPASILMYNKNTGYATPTTAITTYAKYMGTTTPITLTAATVAAASSYEWELPAGVSLTTGTAGTSYDRYFTAEPFTAPLLTVPAPATGTKFWKVTYNPSTYFDANGLATGVVTTSTAKQYIMGADYTYTFTITAGSTAAIGDLYTYNGNTYKVSTILTNTQTSLVCKQNTTTALGTYPTALSTTVSGSLVKVSDSSTIAFTKIVKAGYDATTNQAYAPYGTVISSDKNSILVNFAGVTSSTATALYIGVKSKNGVGVSVTSNATNIDVVASASTRADAIPGLYNRTYSEVFTAPNSTTLTNSISVISVNTTNDSYIVTTAKLVKFTAAVPTAPTTLVLTNPNGTSTTAPVTSIGQYFNTTTPFTLTAGVVATGTSYEWELPTGVVRTDAQGTNSTERFITVNFSDVEPGTPYLYLGVKAKNNIGVSVTLTNGTLIPAPVTPSTAKLLKLTAVAPIAPATLVLTNPTSTTPATAITSIGAYQGTDKELKLTAGVVATATSYEWELPEGVVRKDAQGTNSTSNFIIVDFSGTSLTATTSLYIGVKSKNGFGVSVTATNGTLTPISTSTAKLLKLTAALPATPGVITPSTTNVCSVVGTSTNVTYTVAPVAGTFANGYFWTVPEGASIVGSATSNSIAVSYSSNYTAAGTVTVKSSNGVGQSAAAATLAITRVAPVTPVSISGGTTYSSCNQTFTTPEVIGSAIYTWTVPTGATIVSGQDTNSVVVNYGSLRTAQTIKVKITNGCGLSSAVKSVALTYLTCTPTVVNTTIDETSRVNVTEMYPNPTSDSFNVELSSAKANDVSVTVYSFDGMVVSSKNIQLSEGNNVINENLSSQRNGIYVVRIVNSSTGEVIIKKIVKQ